VCRQWPDKNSYADPSLRMLCFHLLLFKEADLNIPSKLTLSLLLITSWGRIFMNPRKSRKEFFGNLLSLIRAYEWVDKLQQIFIAAFILIIYLPHPERYLIQIAIVGIYVIFLGSYGYVINSYEDRKQDAKVGKHPEALYFSCKQIKVILTFFAIPSLAIPLYFPDVKIKVLGIVTFILVTLYSLKPVRLKERGIWGIFTAALTQRALPFLLFVFLIPLSDLIVASFLLGWLSLTGIVVIMAHQLGDFESDKKARVNTWALKLGRDKVGELIKITLVLMLICILICFLIFPFYDGVAISLVIFAFSGYSILYSVDALKNA
jgi:4-hydroxybenzoate polyprenyltransferase